MTQVSIVIPFFDDESRLETTLVSILEKRPDDCEIIVLHSGNYEDPYDLQDEVEFLSTGTGSLHLPSAFARLISGLDSTVTFLLRCGATLENDALELALDQLEDPYVGSISPQLLNSDGSLFCLGVVNSLFYQTQFVQQGKVNQNIDPDRCGIGPSHYAGIYRTEALQQLDCIADLGESTFGLELALALEAIGFEHKLNLETSIIVDEEHLNHPVDGRESQQAIWRFAGSFGFMQGMLLSLFAVLKDLVCLPFSSSSRTAIGGRFTQLINRRVAQQFVETVENAPGPNSERSILSARNHELSLSGHEETRRAA